MKVNPEMWNTCEEEKKKDVCIKCGEEVDPFYKGHCTNCEPAPFNYWM